MGVTFCFPFILNGDDGQRWHLGISTIGRFGIKAALLLWLLVMVGILQPVAAHASGDNMGLCQQQLYSVRHHVMPSPLKPAGGRGRAGSPCAVIDACDPDG
jgi:hypothetical protein